MGRSSDKKRHYSHNRQSISSNVGIADTLHTVKRRRLSEETLETSSLPAPAQTHGDENDGWQTVPSKSSRRKHEQHDENSDGKPSYPVLSYRQKITKPLQLEALRDLALYVLADGVGPDWVALSKRRSIKKVVTLMVPGLDVVSLKRARELLRSHKGEESKRLNRDVEHLTVETGNTIPVSGSAHKHEDDHDVSESKPEHENCDTHPWDGFEEFLDLITPYSEGWLLEDNIPIKTPGDSKFSKVHSPLQAMLMVPEIPINKASKLPGEKSFKPTATPIDEYVHTSDELRDAEYPVHPSSFASDVDAELEMSRRKATGQSEDAGWVDSKVDGYGLVAPSTTSKDHKNNLSRGFQIYAIDCEMVLTSDQKSSLARVSAVAWPDGKVVIDKYVKPDLPIENYFTQYSGITPEILEKVTTTLADVQEELLKLLTSTTILLGHSLESDLNALKMTHPHIIDTSMLYPHPRGLPLRSSLKYLANKYLKREIQMGGANGHDSVEDARAVLDLVKLKCEKGSKFGTPDASGEPIFKRLDRSIRHDTKLPLTSAIVEYGSSPERGLGNGATHAIGCQNDEQIVAGVIRAVTGDPAGEEIPAGGVDFVWGRLRAMEYAQGWVSNNNTATNHNNNVNIGITNTTGHDTSTNKPPPPPPDESLRETIDRTLLTTLRHLSHIRVALPPTSLLIITSGTSDVRPVLKLQALQAQYRKEFKVKKWDELTVKWTDVEDQALRNAAERARLGWGWVGIV